MDEKDLKNISTVTSIVEKHFSLDEKSLDYFKKELNETTLDPYFANILKEHNSTDLRIRYKIPREVCSTLDNGWKMFISFFPKFIEKYNFTYSNFSENKVLIEKNNIKTRKALLAFYTDAENYVYFRRDLAGHIAIDSMETLKIWETKKVVDPKLIKRITEYIDGALDNISQKCLPKSDIQLVLSCNFIDWFLCSTAESWKSCLNLESEFHAAYWSGLPGLIGDKNRCMFYITDGNKKTYQGITTDKIIARSWGILSNRDILNIIKPYPLADIFDSRIVSSITGLVVRDLGNTMDFISKSRVKLLYFKDERTLSCFIYQDNSAFMEDAHIQRASSGFYAFVEGRLVRGEPIVKYDGGLANLIAENKSIENYIVKKMTCSCCGHTGEDVGLYNIEGQDIVICPSCLKGNYKKCPVCRSYHPKDSYIEINLEGGGTSTVCKECIKGYEKCEVCKKYYSKNELYNVFDTYKNKSRVCDACIKNIPEIVRCTECGSYMPENMLVQADLIGREFMCEKCITRYTDRNQIFFDFMEIPKKAKSHTIKFMYNPNPVVA